MQHFKKTAEAVGKQDIEVRNLVHMFRKNVNYTVDTFVLEINLSSFNTIDMILYAHCFYLDNTANGQTKMGP